MNSNKDGVFKTNCFKTAAIHFGLGLRPAVSLLDWSKSNVSKLRYKMPSTPGGVMLRPATWNGRVNEVSEAVCMHQGDGEVEANALLMHLSVAKPDRNR